MEQVSSSNQFWWWYSLWQWVICDFPRFFVIFRHFTVTCQFHGHETNLEKKSLPDLCPFTPIFFLFGLAVSDILYSEVGRSKFTVKMKFSKKKNYAKLFLYLCPTTQKNDFFFSNFFSSNYSNVTLDIEKSNKIGEKTIAHKKCCKRCFFFHTQKTPIFI